MRKFLKIAARAVCVCLVSLAASPSRAEDAQQNAPASQSPPQQPTAQTQAPSAQPAPPPPAPPVDQFYSGNGGSITLFYWLTMGNPVMMTGRADISAEPSNLNFPPKVKPSLGIAGGIPLGKNATLRLSYFRTQGSGNTTLGQNSIIYGTSFYQGDYLAETYLIQNAKMSLDYLSWPFPATRSRFRFKTLWEVQATYLTNTIDAPLRSGTVDAAGNPIQTTGQGSHWFLYPTFGVGADYLVSKNFRFEARASGFAFPHRSTVWDLEATANYRFRQFEIQAGEKAFHFRTSPNGTEYLRDTLSGLYIGLRWYPGNAPY